MYVHTVSHSVVILARDADLPHVDHTQASTRCSFKMALSFCDRLRALPKVIYHLLMMLVSVGIIAAFVSYVVKAIHDDGFTYQTMYAMSAGAYIDRATFQC